MPSTKPKVAEGTDSLSDHDTPPAILVVDDTPQNLDLLTEMLEPYRVFVALDGPTALELAAAEPFDLVLLDIMMPDMDGYDVCRRLKSDACTRDIPVIFLTALNDLLGLEKAFAVGGVDYVTKPFRPAELLARVKTHLELYAMHTRLAALVEQEIAARQLQERIAQRQARFAVMGEMLDAVAHQWNQPLGAITMANDLLSMQTPPVCQAEITAHCDTVSRQLTFMQDTLYDFRSFLRSDGVVSRTGTRGLIAGVEALLRAALMEAHVTLITDGLPAEASINVNASEFMHVLINLISNAVDAFRTASASKARAITFEQHSSEARTILVVEDNAGGIPDAILPIVFEADVSGKPRGEGSGIGLYMSRRIVEKLGGTITAENTPKGARFTITLPA